MLALLVVVAFILHEPGTTNTAMLGGLWRRQNLWIKNGLKRDLPFQVVLVEKCRGWINALLKKEQHDSGLSG